MDDQPPLDINALSTELTKHPDSQFVSYVINGFSQGFNPLISVVPTTSLECPNNLSARSNTDVVDKAVKSEVDNGYVCGPFDQIPFSICRINPLGLSIGKYSGKPRLILDLSAPHNETEDSINELIDKESCSLSYVTIDQAIQLILQLGHGAQMCKADIKDAFKQVPLHKQYWPYFGFKWLGHYYFYKRLAFGCRSSPKIFDHLSQAICWILQNNYGVPHVLHLLDDFLTIEHSTAPAVQTMEKVKHVFHKLNIPLSLKKTVGPTTRLEYLGIILDSETMVAQLPVDKIERILQAINSFCERKSCTKRELLSLLGHLNYACRVIPPGRAFISYLITLSMSVVKMHHHVSLNKECRRDLDMWRKFLGQWNGISFFHDVRVTNAHDIELFTDAAGSTGYGGFFQGEWFAERWPIEIRSNSKLIACSAFLELYAIVVAANVWGERWKKLRILFRCDNQAVVHIIQKGRGKDRDIMALMRQLTWLAATGNFVITARHVPGVKNEIADALSRLQLRRFHLLAPQAAQNSTPCPDSSKLMWY